MRIVIDRRHDRIELHQPDEFSRFSVVIEGSGPEALAGDTATPAWDEGFAAMVSYAAAKGWVDADEGIQAHIE